MKNRCGVWLCLALVVVVQGVLAADSDVQITCEKKRFEEGPGGALPNSEGSKRSEQWGFAVSMENQGFKALSNLDVKYVIFYKHEELGIKGPPRKESKSGDHPIASLDPLAKISFNTAAVTLTRAALVGPAGGYSYFPNGAKPSATDTLTGIWIRVYQAGKLFAEYAYPAGLTSVEQWPAGE